MKVVIYDPYKKVNEKNFKQVNDIMELLSSSDIVTIHAHLNEETSNMFNKDCFDNMRNGSFFINTSRGEIIDEEALIDALRSEKVSRAAVDVISDEHQIDKTNHPLIKYALSNSNLIITPHIAGLTIDSESKAMQDLIEQIIKSRSIN